MYYKDAWCILFHSTFKYPYGLRLLTPYHLCDGK